MKPILLILLITVSSYAAYIQREYRQQSATLETERTEAASRIHALNKEVESLKRGSKRSIGEESPIPGAKTTAERLAAEKADSTRSAEHARLDAIREAHLAEMQRKADLLDSNMSKAHQLRMDVQAEAAQSANSGNIRKAKADLDKAAQITAERIAQIDGHIEAIRVAQDQLIQERKAMEAAYSAAVNKLSE
jgi:hypothetical protein